MEKVGAVQRMLLDSRKDVPTNGFSYINDQRTLEFLNANMEFLPRNEAENDPDWKQIIPYVIITKPKRVFSTRRLTAGGEPRLYRCKSLGIGGHINPQDKTDICPNRVWAGMWRELHEEVAIGVRHVLPIVKGIINHDEDAVGSVHLGIVFHIPLPKDVPVAIRETNQLVGTFTRWDLLEVDELERWSQFIHQDRQHFR